MNDVCLALAREGAISRRVGRIGPFRPEWVRRYIGPMANADKTAPKTALTLVDDASPIRLAPPSPFSGHRLPLGNHAGNTGGKKGRSGRKPAEWTILCQDLATNPSQIRRMKRILKDPNHKHFHQMQKLVTEYGYGTAPQRIQMSGELNVNVKDVRSRLGERMSAMGERIRNANK